jgi:SAM-dependent methyltransferase
MENTLSQTYWDDRYQENNIGWDIGHVSPPLKNCIDQISNKNAAILIPGAGNAYEADYLLSAGFTHITIIDIAPSVVTKLKEKYRDNPAIKIILGDFFEQEMKFDIILEQTFFCAIDPSLRKKYVEKMHATLNEKGILMGVLFNRSFEGGPPFGGNTEEYNALFSTHFEIKKMEPCLCSIAPRLGHEVMIEFIKK